MRVRAIKGSASNNNNVVGYYNHLRRRVGDEFILSDPKHLSAKWMEKVDDEPKRGRPKKENEGE